MRKLTKKQQKSKNHINFQFTKKCKKSGVTELCAVASFFCLQFYNVLYLELQDGPFFRLFCMYKNSWNRNLK